MSAGHADRNPRRGGACALGKVGDTSLPSRGFREVAWATSAFCLSYNSADRNRSRESWRQSARSYAREAIEGRHEMTDFGYRPPRIRSIVLGIALVVVMLVLLCSLSQVVKWVGTGFLYLPARLGIVRLVSADEAIPVDLSTQGNTIQFRSPGRYEVYVDDADLLILTDTMSSSGALPWLKMTQVSTGATLPIEYVTRGLLPYDTPVVPGRPVFTVEIASPGAYQLTHTVRHVTIWYVPDYTTGNESRFVGAIVVQVLILLMILGAVYYRRQQKRQERLAELRPPLPKP